MKNITLNWFICKVRFVRMLDNGQKKRVTESYVVAASSFAEAESRIVEEMQAYYANEGLEVVEIDRAGFNEIVFMTCGEKVSLEDRMQNTETLWYKSKVQFTDIDMDAGKEKRVNIYYLVEGASLESARKSLDNFLSGSLLDHSIVSVSETSIIDVIVPAQ